jgi:hypothetical protein
MVVKQIGCDKPSLLQKYVIDLKGLSVLSDTSLDLRQFTRELARKTMNSAVPNTWRVSPAQPLGD